MNKCSLTLGLLALLLKHGQGDVIVTDVNFEATIASYHSISASFGKAIPVHGLHGAALGAHPNQACQPIQQAPVIPGKNISWIAVIARYGGCTFEDKVRNAMNANFSGAIIYNVDSNKVIPMGGEDEDLIPSVFIGASHAKQLLKHFTFSQNPNIRLILTDEEPFDINAYLLPFAIVVGICFLIMLGIVVVKCIQDHRRRMRHRLPKSALKKLPIHKFKAGDPFETCCICLDDFEEGDKLRILPCDHGYHYKCIDPWLVKNKRICPQCRKRVFARGSGYDSEESEDTERNERAPLIRQSGSGSSGGTFGGPSTSAAALRLMQDQQQQPSSSTMSEPSTLTTTSESRLLLQHRRFRRPRRLRRVYEVLSESTTSSDNEDDQAEEGWLDEAAGGGEPGVDHRVFEHTEPTFVVPSLLLNGDESNVRGIESCKEVSAEVHVQVHGGNNRVHDDEEDEESPPEIQIYRTSTTSDDNDDDAEAPPRVVVTTAVSGSPPAPQGASAESA